MDNLSRAFLLLVSRCGASTGFLPKTSCQDVVGLLEESNDAIPRFLFDSQSATRMDSGGSGWELPT